ncbi:MAG: hypothetical protein FJ395_20690 [Verrucomicrobia bacterium]|nr:hypothetical protein [Verrucomicrobiota bacterium]
MMKCIKVMVVTALVFAVIGIAIFFGRRAWLRHEQMKDPVTADMIRTFKKSEEETEAWYKALRASQRAAYRAAGTKYNMIPPPKYVRSSKNDEFLEGFESPLWSGNASDDWRNVDCYIGGRAFWLGNTNTPENQALMGAKTKRYMDCAQPVTVARFLGDKVTSYRVVHFIDTAGDAVALVREVLHSVLRYSDHGWYVHEYAEGEPLGFSRVRALTPLLAPLRSPSEKQFLII